MVLYAKRYTTAKCNRREENRHLLEVARSLIFTKGVSKHFCRDAAFQLHTLLIDFLQGVQKFRTPISLLPNPTLAVNLRPNAFGYICCNGSLMSR